MRCTTWDTVLSRELLLLSRFLLPSLIVVGWLSCPVDAGTLLISNGSFENGSDLAGSGDNKNLRQIDDWFEESDGNGTNAGQAASAEQALNELRGDPGTSEVPDTPFGTYWAHFLNRSTLTRPNDEAMYQLLGTWNTGDATSYILSGLLGDRPLNTFGDANGNLVIEFYSVDQSDAGVAADGAFFDDTFSTEELLGSGTVTMTNTDDMATTATFSKVFDFNTANLNDGDQIYLRLSQPGGVTGPNANHTLFDNLSISVVPEPASMVLVLCGLAMATRIRRTR